MDTSRVMTGTTMGASERGFGARGRDAWARYLGDPNTSVYVKNITPHTLSIKDRWNEEGLDVTVAGLEAVDLSSFDRQHLSNSHALKKALMTGLLVLVNEEQYYADQNTFRVRQERAQQEINMRRQAEIVDVGGRPIEVEVVDGTSAPRQAMTDPRLDMKNPLKYAAMVQQAMQNGMSPEQFADAMERQRTPVMAQAPTQYQPPQYQPPQYQPPQYQQPPMEPQYQPPQYQPPQYQQPPMEPQYQPPQYQQPPMEPQYQPPQYQQPPMQPQYQPPMGAYTPMSPQDHTTDMGDASSMTVEAQTRGPRPISPSGTPRQVPGGAGTSHMVNDPLSMTRTGGATVRMPSEAGQMETMRIPMGNHNVYGNLPGWDGAYGGHIPQPTPVAPVGYPQQVPSPQTPQLVYPNNQPIFPQVQPPPSQSQGPMPPGYQETLIAQQVRQASQIFDADEMEGQGPPPMDEDIALSPDIRAALEMIGGMPK